MERVLSQDERIRRAEEIYARRQSLLENKRSATVNVEQNKENKFTKKLIIQSVICLIIYGIFYGIKSMPQFVSDDVMYKIADVLEYDINVQELYKNITSYIKSLRRKKNQRDGVYRRNTFCNR